MNGNVPEETQAVLKESLGDTLRDVAEIAKHKGRKTSTTQDILYALNSKGMGLFR